MNDKDRKSEVATFSTKSYPTSVCSYLMSRKVPFQFEPSTGVSFTATATFVSEMSRRLVNSYGCKHYPVYQLIK
jgi:hypothetical protein